MRTRTLIFCGLAALALTVTATGCGSGDVTTAELTVDAPAADSGSAAAQEAPAASTKKPKVTIPSGAPPKKLEIKDLKTGTGPAVKKGDDVSVNYVGVSYSTGKEFDNSYDRGQPFDFTVGQGQVIAGWDEGLIGMKKGGRRELTIPPDKGYGAAGQPPTIKPNETLVFIVDLVAIK